MLACGMLFGVAARAAQPADLSHLQLQAAQGVLVVSVDTDMPLKSLRFRRLDQAADEQQVAEQAVAGRSVQFLVLPAGHYRWTEVDLGGANSIPLDRSASPRYEFTVQAGKVSYPGDFVVRAEGGRSADQAAASVTNGASLADVGYSLSLVDRYAMLLDALAPAQRDALGRLGLVYVGPGGDDFPFYEHAVTRGHTP
ncbi:MAG TPA: hypothetical protein VF651_07260 [Gammaproteobacteria bacterium]